MQGFAPGVATLAASRSLGAGLSAGLSPVTNSYVAVSRCASGRWLSGSCRSAFRWGAGLGIAAGGAADVGVRLAGDLHGQPGRALPLGGLIYRSLQETDRFKAVKAAAANRPPVARATGRSLWRPVRAG